MEDNNILMKVLPFFGLLIQVIEMMLYTIMYFDIITHNQLMVGESVISKEVYKSRQQHNSFTLGSQVAWYAKKFLYNLF
jgi:hypothetical protein